MAVSGTKAKASAKARLNGEAHGRSNRRRAKCLGCGCTNIRCRGLCSKCYNAALYMIERGDATEAALEKDGLIKPSQRRSEFRKAVEAKGGGK